MKNGLNILKDGTKKWLKGNKLHRTDGPAVERANGDKYWCQNDQLHRTDGPAIEYSDGGKEWWQNDQLHRTDGHAVERANGDKEWWICGEEYTEEEFKKYLLITKLAGI